MQVSWHYHYLSCFSSCKAKIILYFNIFLITFPSCFIWCLSANYWQAIEDQLPKYLSAKISNWSGLNNQRNSDMSDTIDTLLATLPVSGKCFFPTHPTEMLIDLGLCLVVFLEEDIHPDQYNFSIWWYISFSCQNFLTQS